MVFKLSLHRPPLCQVAVNATFLLQRVLPVGVAFATSLICSNVAYEYVPGPKFPEVLRFMHDKCNGY